jgi:hypothetical protein
MNSVTLAYQDLEARTLPPPRELAIFVAILVGFLVISFITGWVWNRLRPTAANQGRRPKGPMVSGTARVLSFAKSADYRGRSLCRIELEVNIPDRVPYVQLTEQNLSPPEQAAVQPGKTVEVRVQVDPDDGTKYVRIDFNQPIT